MTYLIRLDDACETMNWKNWLRMETLLDTYGVKPLIAVIPNNADEMQKIDPPKNTFWEWLKNVEDKGWEIGLHGNDHVYRTTEGGINPIHKRSEFAGLSLIEQKEKIKDGFSKLKSKGFNPRIFIAPSHTFDLNTLKALKSESSINIISDTMALHPYTEHGFVFIPQQIGAARNMIFPGTYTFCYHPNTMDDMAFNDLEVFFKKNTDKLISFSNLEIIHAGSKSLFDKALSFLYFKFRIIFR